MRKFLIVLWVALFAIGAAYGSQPLRVIVETDMGNDIDDAIAMDLVYKGIDEGAFKLLGVSCHKKSATVAEYVDILNTWYGYPKTAVAVSATPVGNGELPDYTATVVELTDNDKPVFARTKSAADVQESVDFYRRTLAKQPDHSVAIISLGFGTNLAALLASPADRFSKLTGRELVARKVKVLSIMAGSFGPKIRAEFNVVNDIRAMRRVFEEWPTEVVMSPFELGRAVRYPADVMTYAFGWAPYHPVVYAYTHFMKMPYNRPLWDPTSVVWLTHPELFTVSDAGRISVDSDGYTSFESVPDGKHRVLSVNDSQAHDLLCYIVNETLRHPARLQK